MWTELDVDVYLINPESNIAIATLWAKPATILSQLPNGVVGKIGVIGRLYSAEGVNHVIATLATKATSVDTVIVFGPDLSGSGEALIKALSGECPSWLRIPCDLVRRLGVRVVDLRREWPRVDALARAIEENYSPGAKREPIPIEIPRPEPPRGYPWPTGWGVAYDTSLFHLWVKVLDYVLTYGYPKPTEYGDWQLEASIAAQWILMGREPRYEDGFARYISVKPFEDYAREIHDPTPPPPGVAYTYGHRLRGSVFGDQLEAVVEKLARAPHTRRAVMATWQPGDIDSSDPPCILVIQFLVHGEYLDATAYIRSNDMVRAWPANIYAVAKLAETVAREVSARTGRQLRLGIVTTLSASAHIYDRDVELARRIVEENWRVTWSREVYDPRGNYVLARGETQHYAPDTTLLRRFPADRQVLKREAAKLAPDHAFYLGEEWAASQLLGEAYEQEKWRNRNTNNKNSIDS